MWPVDDSDHQAGHEMFILPLGFLSEETDKLSKVRTVHGIRRKSCKRSRMELSLMIKDLIYSNKVIYVHRYLFLSILEARVLKVKGMRPSMSVQQRNFPLGPYLQKGQEVCLGYFLNGD